MKKQLIKPFILCGVMITALAFTACGKDTEKNDDREWSETVTYSNLNDQESRDLLTKLMTDAGVTNEKQNVLFKHVDQINELLPPEELTNGFETHSIKEPKYDAYELQEKWMEKYPDFLGYNCRITAYTVFSDFVNIPAESKTRTDLLTMDLDSLGIDRSAVPGGTTKFEQFFSTVPTQNTKKTEKHVKNLQKDWEDRSIKFEKNDKMSLVSLVLHDQIDEDQLFIGHIGVLFPSEDGSLYFLEKLAFQEPYQLCKFSSREELSDYFMTKYDTDYNQSTAAPLVMENSELIEGYRVVDKKQ